MTMTLNEFRDRIRRAVTPGSTFQNPGGGTSLVKNLNNERISYIRGSSTISVSLADLFSAYKAFHGKRVSSTDLRKFSPAVFDSHGRPAGHSCNCTFLFEVLDRAGLAGDRSGSGVRGNPFSIVFNDSEAT